MQFLSGRRWFVLAVAIVSLTVSPFLTFAGKQETAINNDDSSGFSRAEKDIDTEGTVIPSTFVRSNYVWPYAAGPYYGDVSANLQKAPGTLRTAVGSFRLAEGLTTLPGELRTTNKLDQVGAQYFIFQLSRDAIISGSLDSMRGKINAGGGQIVRHLQVSSFIARVDKATMGAVVDTPGLLAVEPYHAAFKLDPAIGRSPLVNPLDATSDIYKLEMRIFEGEDSASVAQAIAAMGGNVLSVRPGSLVAEVHRERLAQLASLEPIEWIYEKLPTLMHAEETTSTMQAGFHGGVPNKGVAPYSDAGIRGQNQILMVLDSGIQLDAADLSNDHLISSGDTDLSDDATINGSHRKVILYETTNQFAPGDGDLLGCDASNVGGFTHGHTVSTTALGNADHTPGGGNEFLAEDTVANGGDGQEWNLDGVAPDAKLIAYDAQRTPAAASCSDPGNGSLFVGTLYSGGVTGSLGESYSLGATVANFSWGSDTNTYSSSASEIDSFISDKQNALVFVAAGNSSLDADNDNIPDEGTLDEPATFKNGFAIGGSGNANDTGAGGSLLSRYFFSSVGPAPGGRIAPQLMAPGTDFGGAGNMGIDSEYSCLTTDNGQDGTVECDLVEGLSGTSFASPAAAGAALIVSEYFHQGFFPDATGSNPANAGDVATDVSAALLKAVLVASAEYMPGGNLTVAHRFNNEQGYGRIELDNVLPLQSWPFSVTGLLVKDGGLIGGAGIGPANLTLPGAIDAVGGGSQSTMFEVCDDSQLLKVSLAWIEGSGSALANDLNLTVTAPAPDSRVYYGNYFTDDDNRDGAIDGVTEDCGSIVGGAGGILDASRWSLPVCVRGNATTSPQDGSNPTEAIYLTPDFDGDGTENDPNDPFQNDTNPADDRQVIAGMWTVEVSSPGGGTDASQQYAVVIAGGVCGGSSVRLDQAQYVCNAEAEITITDVDEAGDLAAGVTIGEVSGRTTVEVLDPNDVVVDTETGLTFTQVGSSLKFESSIVMTDATAPDPGNGVLDVSSGDSIRVTYADEIGGTPDVNKVRVNTADVDCRAQLSVGTITFGLFGTDTNFFVNGGCERNARGNFEFGFPDRYLDAGENIVFNFTYGSNETTPLENAEVSMRCVMANDALANEDCRPGTPSEAGCTNSNRTLEGGHLACGAGIMSILNSPQTVGLIPGGAAIASNFAIQLPESLAGTPEVELVIELTAATSGKTGKAVAVSRQTLNVDETEVLYSTDFPGGGVENRDRNNNELLEAPTTNIGDFLEDYRFESRTFLPLTANSKNANLGSPWNFDSNDGGFVSGITANTDITAISQLARPAQWGEDQNFDGALGLACAIAGTPCTTFGSPAECPIGGDLCIFLEDRDPRDGQIQKSWSTLGGCGWQTKAPGTCSLDPSIGCYNDGDCAAGGDGVCSGGGQATGGVWHTGTIGDPAATNCLVVGPGAGDCQAYEIIGGDTGQAAWREVLISPEMEKVSNDPDVEVRLVTVEWNQAIELGDSNAVYFWSVDTDTSSALPVDIKRDGGALNAGGGSYGAVSGGGNPALSDGYSMFTTLDPGTRQSINGTVGNNREGKSSCYFEDPLAIALDTLQDDLGLAGPEDDDINNRYCIDAPNRSCTSNADCSDLTDTTCAAATGITDDYVAKNGPARNADLNDWNGLDMRFFTLEDVFGPTGDTWETAIGLSVFEKLSPSDSDPVADFGLAVDDWNVEWKEVSLTVDNTTCTTGGDCAVLDLDTFQFFEGNSLVSITLLERSPSVNDCNDDGDYIDAEDDFNCDNDATNDVRVKVTSEAEIEGEFVNLELTSAACNCEYRGQIAVSVSYDVDPGVLFLQQSGTDPPTVTVTYDDRFDGISGPCDNSIDPEANGLVQAATPVFITTGNVQVLDYALVDNQPLNDGWADTNETVDMFLTIGNKTGVPLTGVSARLQTNDPKIDCVTKPFIEIGDFEEGETRITPVPFTFHVSPTANRAGEFEEFTSDFQIILESDQLLAPTFPQTLTIDLDLSASGGSAPAIFFDGFEGAVEVADSLFEIDNIDSTLFGPVPSDGFRCQYSDPDYVNSNSYGQIDDCWVGSSGTAAAAVNWWINTTANPNGGRGYSGDQSLYYGVDPEDVAFDAQTTRLAVIEAVQTTDPINIGWDTVCSLTRTTICANDGNCPGGETCVPVAPTLSFKHQISVMDSRSVNVNAGESADRGVISVQLADGAGVGSGNWIKITPFDNVYDQQGTDNYQECLFDPTDDGTTEDDFFDPTDPNRRLGPSSTCFPSLSFVFLGDTFEQNSFAELNLGNASDGPGLLGNNGAGTWVESKFSLQRFRGRRIRTRFLLSSIKVGGTETYEAAFDFNPDPGDDGWWIDDVTITDTLTNAATVIVDNDDNSALPGCGINCSGVIAGLTVDPAGVIPAPGQAVEVTADTSSATACLDGVLQFRYSIDLNGDDMSGGPGELFRDWTDNPDLLQAPTATTTYVVDVRCSNQTPTLCQDSAAIEVVVTCPSTGTLTSGFPDITATDVNTLVWSPATLGTYAKGLDATLSSYTPSGTGGVVGTSHDMTPDNPVSGEFYWYLIRDNAGGSGPACNVSGSGFVWGNAARDASPNLP